MSEPVVFGPFRLDAANARLLRDGRPVALTPKAIEVLGYLATRPEQLVTKQELLSSVWPDVFVTDASIKVCVREIRQALGDGVKNPKFIETVHRRGYRFIGFSAADRPGMNSEKKAALERASDGLVDPEPSPSVYSQANGGEHILVARDEQLRQLKSRLREAVSGTSHCVFLAGGAGTGKTALLESFLEMAATGRQGHQPPIVVLGHCFEQFGSPEPYMPLWVALARVAREHASAAVSGLLASHLEALAPPDETREPGNLGSAVGTAVMPRSRSQGMLRNIIEVLDALAAEAPVILALEDVHWADYSTLDLISALARHRGSRRLMLLATYRPAEVLVEEHPLPGIVQGLTTARLCSVLTLQFLDQAGVGAYLAARFPANAFPDLLCARIYRRTMGHPLFLVHLVDGLIEQGVLRFHQGRWQLPHDEDGLLSGTSGGGWMAVLDTQVPQTVRAMIELQLSRLEERQRQVLEAAAVAGVEFSAAAVALISSGSEPLSVVEAERICESIARRHRLLDARGILEWPNGAVATCYRFIHEMYHNVVYEQIPLARRVHLHQVLGARLEQIWGDRSAEESPTLAMHFEQGRNWAQAVKYLRLAAKAAARQYAHREAVNYLYRADDALRRLGEAERAIHELPVLILLGVNLQVTKGFAAPEVERVHQRAYELCLAGGTRPSQSDADPQEQRHTVFRVLWGIWLFHKVRSNLRKAWEMTSQLLQLAREADDPGLILQAHQAISVTSLCMGKPPVTRDQIAPAMAIYDPNRHARNTQAFGQDPGVATLAFGAVALCLLERSNDALRHSRQALDLAQHSLQPSSRALALHFAAMLHQCQGDAVATESMAQQSIELAAREGFSFWLAGGVVLRGWAWVMRCAGVTEEVVAEAGLAEIQRGIDAWLATGSRTYHTYYLGLLAEALLRLRRCNQALAVLEEAIALARDLPEGLYEAELHRLKGLCLFELADRHSALEAIQQAIDIAHQQGCTLFETKARSTLLQLDNQRPSIKS